MQTLTFAFPWIFLLAPLPLLVRWLIPPAHRSSPAVRVPFLPRLLKANGGRAADGPSNGELGFAVRGLVWLLILAALAKPQILEPPIERTLPTRDMLLLVDLSGSMQQEDFKDATGRIVDRLTAVKDVVGEFLIRREGDRVGLVVFGNSAFLQVPFTTDLRLCQQLLDETAVGMAGPKTALGDAIGLGIQLFDSSDVPTKTIIALTDGNDTGSAVPPAEAARIAKDREITIHTVAIGDPTTVGEEKLDEQSLKAVAEMTGGGYFMANDREELIGIYQRLDAVETREVETVSHRPRRDLYYWFVVAAMIVSIVSHVWRLLNGRRRERPAESSFRLRVNPRTFELEPTQ